MVLDGYVRESGLIGDLQQSLQRRTQHPRGSSRGGDVACVTPHQLLEVVTLEPFDERWNGDVIQAHGLDKVFYPGLGRWNNKDFQDEWKTVDERGRLVIGP